MRVDVLGVKIDKTNILDAVERAMSLMEERRAAMIVAPDAEMIMRARASRQFRATLNYADVVLPSGEGILLASRILGTVISERVDGLDFARALLARMSDTGKSVFLYGAWSGVAEAAAKNIRKRYPGIVIAGTNEGHFSSDDDVIAKINAARPDFLIVCLGSPKQEHWMYECQPELDVGVMAGLGSAIDIMSGYEQPTPRRWRELGLEWLYRFIKKPKRFRRTVKLPLMILAALWRRLTGR